MFWDDAARHKGLMKKDVTMEKDFHMEIRNASKHQLVELIEDYDSAIKKANKNSGFNIPTLENLWNELEEERKSYDRKFHRCNNSRN